MTSHIIDPETDTLAWIIPDASASPSAPQPVHIEMRPGDDDVALYVKHTYNHDNLWTFAHHYGHILRWTLQYTVDPVALTAAINAGEITPLLERIRAGYDTRVENGNVVATYTDDASTAIAELDTWFDDAPLLRGENAGYIAAADWFAIDDPEGLTADTTDAELADIVADCEDFARSENAYVDDIAEYLADRRQQLQWDRDDA